MPTYTIKDPQSGRTVKLTGDSPPTEAELSDIFSKLGPASAPAPAAAAPATTQAVPAQAAPPPQTAFGMTLRPDLQAAMDKEGVMAEPMMPNVIAPVRAAVNAIPTMAKAGAKFQQVMGAAKDVPLDISAPGNVALRIQQLAERGGTMPKVVRDFLKRVTDPSKPNLAYEEARDFYSNISRLSGNDYQRLTPVLVREIGNLRVALNSSLRTAAETVGKGGLYDDAMKGYRQAAKVSDAVGDAAKQIKRWAIPTGIVTYGANKLSKLMGGD